MLDPRSLTRFRKNKGALLGATLVLFVGVLSVTGPYVAPFPPDLQMKEGFGTNGLPRGPDARFALGTDTLGRDELSRLLHGGEVSMRVALFATSIALLLGLGVGVASGYFGGVIDSVSMRAVDVLLSMPFLLIAIALNRAIDKPGLWSLYLLLGGLSWASLARVTRAKVLSVREQDYVHAARALGASTPRILFRHVLPNVIGPAIAIGTSMVADMIIAESAMSFLGLGVQPPQSSWGNMLYEGRDMIAHAPLLLAAPALLIALTVFGFNLLGEGLRDALDPKA